VLPGDHPDKITTLEIRNACWNICGDLDADYSVAVNYTDIQLMHTNPTPAKLETLHREGHWAWFYGNDPTWRPAGKNLYEWFIQYHNKFLLKKSYKLYIGAAIERWYNRAKETC
jgi:hypothetical protein